jgi:DNA polymerase III epsilon subunit-like protein
VVQIGALLTDDQGKTLAEFNVLLKPDGFDHVPVDAANVHGFSFELIEKAGISRVNAIDTFFDLVELADTLVAHNIEYDMDLMNIEIDYYRKQAEQDTRVIFDRWQKILDSKQQFCTMLNARDTLMMPLSDAQARFFRDTGNDQKFKNPRLIEAYQHFFHKDFEGAHDAMADVRACRDVYFELHKLKAAA